MNSTNNKEISTKTEINQKEVFSEEESEHLSKSYYINKLQKILLDIDEKPEVIIEKILISIFNKYIGPEEDENEYFDIDYCRKKINRISIRNEKRQIIFILLSKIRSIIKKYKEKIFELTNIIELKEKIFPKVYRKSYSPNKTVSDMYYNFALSHPTFFYKSYPKQKRNFYYYGTVKSLFYELKNIKNCLEKTAPIIEKIFEIPLSGFEKFSIYECEREDYSKILIHDTFIWNEIIKNRGTKLSYIIDEITEDDNINLTLMTEKIDYFKRIQKGRKPNIDEIFKMSPVGSSIDTRYPEDAKPAYEINFNIKECYENIIPEISNINNDFDLDELSNTIANTSNTNSNIYMEEDQMEQIDETIHSIDDDMIINKIKEMVSKNELYTKENQSKKEKEKSYIQINNIKPIDMKEEEDEKYIEKDKPLSNIPIKKSLKNDNNINNNNYFINKSKLNLEKHLSFHECNFHNELNNILDKNISSINFGKLKPNKINLLKNKEKANNNENNKFAKQKKKSDKTEVPSDIDDLVKYIVNDDKAPGGQNKKKKKNKKRNKKNKEKEKEKEENDAELEQKEKDEEDKEIKEVKDYFNKNSINRHNIYKIKFKYKPRWLKKISNYP
jgi:NADH:ubiquinone oxidoreductase subunit